MKTSFNWKCTPIVILILCCRADAVEQDLKTLKAIYTAEVQQLEKKQVQTLDKLINVYTKSLDGVVQALKQGNDPQKILTAFEEKKRSEKERTVPAKPDKTLPKRVQTLQTQYHKAFNAAEIEKARHALALSARYMQALDATLQKLTMANEFEEALRVKKERTIVQRDISKTEAQLSKLQLKSKTFLCKICGGDKYVTQTNKQTCRSCKGSGTKPGLSTEDNANDRPCLNCKGDGFLTSTSRTPCTKCSKQD